MNEVAGSTYFPSPEPVPQVLFRFLNFFLKNYMTCISTACLEERTPNSKRVSFPGLRMGFSPCYAFAPFDLATPQGEKNCRSGFWPLGTVGGRTRLIDTSDPHATAETAKPM